MLDTNTKKRIDDCRDILVGKLPEPKSQIDQITLALIYKFMDDMDQQSRSFGGVASFFVGDFEKYSWSNIMSAHIGANTMLKLYSEGIEKMSENETIQPLFRSIFKDAYLPYRDPETLKMFLKKINEFSYDHSEILGDAFEYLLSVMGSQGDAGQFRTPRHIIDFMVDITSPKKDETILDPSCGTSGFLISAYKKIISDNTKDRPGDLLSSMEKKKLLGNVSGYDISPDMIRLSLANLFLHGFNEDNLKIFEYDTLTSLDRWNEYYDVILANPPFMTPKGGIRPHNRFSIKSNRAEVLFVNYIMEHLTPKGRAAIVVPEGIIFQSGNAYKDLRKSLIEKSLIGVISLPSGVFNPYSAVKTSILILDKELSQKTDKIFLSKIENDGYNLGAQRREIDKNDLPIITKEVTEYLNGLRNGMEVESQKLNFISKEHILSSSDIGLSFDRYTIRNISNNSSVEFKLLIDLCDIYQPKTITKNDLIENGEYLVYGANGVIGKYNQYNHENEQVLVTCRGATCGYLNYSQRKSWITGNAMVVKPFDETLLNKKYLLFILRGFDFNSVISGSAQPQITRTSLEPSEIPVPPLEVQKEIIGELEQYQKVIDGAKQVVDNYKPHIDINNNWENIELKELTEVITKGSTPTTYGYKFQEAGINFIKIENLNEEGVIEKDKLSFISKECYSKFKRSQLKKDDILFSIAGTKMGIIGYVEKDILPANTNQALCIIRLNDKTRSKFLFYYLKSNIIQDHLERVKVGVAQSNISLKQIGELRIPILNENQENLIVEKLEEERLIIEGNKKLIEVYTKKIEDRINKIWES